MASDATVEEAAATGAEVTDADAGEESGAEDEAFFAPAPEEIAAAEPPAEAFEKSGDDRPARPSRERHAPPQSRGHREPRPEPPPPPAQPAAPASIRKALEEVEAALSALREAAETMDELLELIEEAERQKTADEREIEALRQVVRRFHGPPDQIPRRPDVLHEPREFRDTHEPRDISEPAEAYRKPSGDYKRRRGGRGRGRGGGGGGHTGTHGHSSTHSHEPSGGHGPHSGGSHGTDSDNAS